MLGLTRLLPHLLGASGVAAEAGDKLALLLDASVKDLLRLLPLHFL